MNDLTKLNETQLDEYVNECSSNLSSFFNEEEQSVQSLQSQANNISSTANNTEKASSPKKKTGCPVKNDDQKHDKLVKLYLTTAQKKWLLEQQEKAGYRSSSRFLYNTLVSASCNDRILFEIQTQVNDDIQRQIRGLANNVNQAMAFMHSTSNPDHIYELTDNLNKALALLKEHSDSIRHNTVKELAPVFPAY